MTIGATVEAREEILDQKENIGSREGPHSHEESCSDKYIRGVPSREVLGRDQLNARVLDFLVFWGIPIVVGALVDWGVVSKVEIGGGIYANMSMGIMVGVTTTLISHGVLLFSLRQRNKRIFRAGRRTRFGLWFPWDRE